MKSLRLKRLNNECLPRFEDRTASALALPGIDTATFCPGNSVLSGATGMISQKNDQKRQTPSLSCNCQKLCWCAKASLFHFETGL
jgi:hypothetical protein